MEIKLKLTKTIPRLKIIGDSKEYENETILDGFDIEFDVTYKNLTIPYRFSEETTKELLKVNEILRNILGGNKNEM